MLHQRSVQHLSSDNHEFNYESISNPQKAKKYIFAYICIEYDNRDRSQIDRFWFSHVRLTYYDAFVKRNEKENQ